MDFSSLVKEKKAKPYAIKGTNQKAIKDVDFSSRTVTGFYNSCYYFDSDQDVSLPGCTLKSITERGPESSAVQKIKHLKDHVWGLIPGRIVKLEEKTIDGITGTYFETKMANTTLGNDTLINYQEEVYDNHSFGFQYMEGKLITTEDQEEWGKMMALLKNPEEAEKYGYLFAWKEYRMFEGSTVAFGANALTPYLGVKSMNKEALALKVNDRITLLQKQLSTGTQSDDMMQSFEMQMLQLKQLVNELFAEEPDMKDTLIKGRAKQESTPRAKKALDFSPLGALNN